MTPLLGERPVRLAPIDPGEGDSFTQYLSSINPLASAANKATGGS